MPTPRAIDDAVAAPDLEILPGRVDGPLRFPEIFGRQAPIEIEVGVGKGRFIQQAAEERPGVDFLGLEWSLKHLRIAKDRAARRGLKNLRFHRADARHVLSALVEDASITRLHIYCPDPWPKKRHHKRRLFVSGTLPHLERILTPGGYLNLSTDVREYYDEIQQALRDGTRLQPAADPLYPIDAPGRTNYESKYLEAGRPVHRATWRRVAGLK